MGSYTHGKPYLDGRTYFRTDTYHSDRYPDLDGQRDRLFAASLTDDTPIWDGRIGQGYDAKCSCCYLGFAHTTAAHQHRS